MRGILALFLLGSGVVALQAIWPLRVSAIPYFVPVGVVGVLLAGKKW